MSEQHAQWIERSRRKIADMLEIIGDWLTISKVEGGQLATERCPVRWPELAAEVLETFTTAACDNNLTLDNRLSSALPAVIGDATALRMLLSNLVANAVKYNRPGGTVSITGQAEQATLVLSVADTGLGIAPENQERVFEEFYRGPNQGAAGKGGTGMGLPICKKIAEELGGGITLSSRPGEGSTFTVILPRAGDEAPTDERARDKTS